MIDASYRLQRKDKTTGLKTSMRYLDHPRMVSSVVAWPWSPIVHGPSLLEHFLCFGHKSINLDLVKDGRCQGQEKSIDQRK